MWCLIGLGNPGEKYRNTRHNVGFELIDRLSERWNIPIKHGNTLFHFGSGDFGNTAVLLVKPQTYMNRSGAAYKRLLQDPAVSPSETVIIYDDMHLPLARLRLRAKGSAGGHNGLKSILESAGTQDIPRLRIGIEGVEKDWVDYVLSPFTKQEQQEMDEALERGCLAIEALLTDGMEKTMNQFNR